MAESIPDAYVDILHKQSFAHLATTMPDGTPQVSPVWIDYDGTHLIVNSARGRQKDRNMERDPNVALSILDPENPYRYLLVRGVVAEITEEGANDHADRMAQKYMGVERYPFRQPTEVRILYKVLPQNVTAQG